MRWLRGTGIVLGIAALAGVAVAIAPAVAGQVVVRQTPGTGRMVVRQAPGTGRVQVFSEAEGAGQLGVSVADVEPGAKAATGAVVRDVATGSPAEKAGIKAGDVLVEFDGERVRSAAQLRRLVRETPPGREVKVGVVRDGKRLDLAVTLDRSPGFAWEGNLGGLAAGNLQGLLGEQKMRDLQQRMGELEQRLRDRLQNRDFRLRVEPFLAPQPPGQNAPFPAPQFRVGRGQMGVAVDELTPQLAEYFGTKDGVLVASVTDNSPADRAGLKAGDVVTSIDGKEVRSRADLTRLLADGAADRTVAVGVVRDRKPQTIKVKLEGMVRRVPI